MCGQRMAREVEAVVAARVNAFLGGELDEPSIAAVVEPSLYRERSA